MSARVKDAGFTLLETLMAVFILALLMSAGGVLLTSTLNTSQVVEARLEQLGKMEIVTAHLRADLANSVPRVSRSALREEDGKGFYGGEADRNGVVLGLLRSGRTNIDNLAARSQLLGVTYRYANGQLIRRIDESPDRTRQTPKHETVLMEGLQSVEILFEENGVALRRWELVLEEDIQVLPDAVTVIMTFRTGESLVQNFLVGVAT